LPASTRPTSRSRVSSPSPSRPPPTTTRSPQGTPSLSSVSRSWPLARSALPLFRFLSTRYENPSLSSALASEAGRHPPGCLQVRADGQPLDERGPNRLVPGRLSPKQDGPGDEGQEVKSRWPPDKTLPVTRKPRFPWVVSIPEEKKKKKKKKKKKEASFFLHARWKEIATRVWGGSKLARQCGNAGAEPASANVGVVPLC